MGGCLDSLVKHTSGTGLYRQPPNKYHLDTEGKQGILYKYE